MLLISLRCNLADEIYSGTKRCELRKSQARLKRGELVAIYETRPHAAITGTFEVEDTCQGSLEELWTWIRDSGVPRSRFLRYFSRRDKGFAIRVRNPFRFEMEIPLETAVKLSPTFRPPQSFLYLQRHEPVSRLIEYRVSMSRTRRADLPARKKGGHADDTPLFPASNELSAGRERTLVSYGLRLESRPNAIQAD